MYVHTHVCICTLGIEFLLAGFSSHSVDIAFWYSLDQHVSQKEQKNYIYTYIYTLFGFFSFSILPAPSFPIHSVGLNDFRNQEATPHRCMGGCLVWWKDTGSELSPINSIAHGGPCSAWLVILDPKVTLIDGETMPRLPWQSKA